MFDFSAGPDNKTQTETDGDSEPQRDIVAAYHNDSSMTMTVPHKISDSVGIESGDQLVVTETADGFTVEVIDFGD